MGFARLEPLDGLHPEGRRLKGYMNVRVLGEARRFNLIDKRLPSLVRFSLTHLIAQPVFGPKGIKSPMNFPRCHSHALLTDSARGWHLARLNSEKDIFLTLTSNAGDSITKRGLTSNCKGYDCLKSQECPAHP